VDGVDNIFTIELNLDDDFANSRAYHVNELKRTIHANISHAETKQKTNRWALVGLAWSLEEALEKSYELRHLLCKKHGREPIDF
jgi:hypothetical protein